MAFDRCLIKDYLLTYLSASPVSDVFMSVVLKLCVVKLSYSNTVAGWLTDQMLSHPSLV